MEDHKPAVGSFSLERDGWDRLVLTDETGNRYVGVEAVRAFPVSDPQHAISICDSRGREIVYLPALDALPRESGRRWKSNSLSASLSPSFAGS